MQPLDPDDVTPVAPDVNLQSAAGQQPPPPPDSSWTGSAYYRTMPSAAPPPPGYAGPGYAGPGYYPMPPATSQTNPLVWLLVCVGVLVSVGILVAIAIPVFLHNRATAMHLAAVPRAAAGTTMYSFPERHFSAAFVNAPQERSTSETDNGFTETVYTEGDTASSTVAEYDEITPALPDTARESFMKGFSDAAAQALTVRRQQDITFRGKPGRRIDATTRTGTDLTIVVFIQSSTRAYTLIAPSGVPFENLANSFAVLP